ncbi:MAG: Gfo/Idh/MocA family oxidoreductase [Lentisphaeria bacterium]|nr:Gfo/Idh/MocA family oxidoreductase [Lentisphaeria bacterium]
MSTKKILRCGVCGLGRIGWGFHLPAIARTGGMTLAAVADPMQERLDEAKKTCQAPACFADWRQMADPRVIDLAVIASPTAFHREQTEYFLQRGIDVFCDKPMALTHADAEAMADCSKKCGRKLMIYQPHRTTGLTLTAKKIIASGKLGKIYQIGRRCLGFTRRNDWQAFAAQGGGTLNNYGAHFIDQLLYAGADTKGRALRCETGRILSGGDAEDFVTAVIRGDATDILYRLEINMACALTAPDMEIFGDRGTARAENGVWKLRYCEKLDKPEMFPGMAAPGRKYPPRVRDFTEEELPVPDTDALAWYDHCRAFFGENAAPFVPVEETLEVMRLLEECRISAAEFLKQSHHCSMENAEDEKHT